MYDRNDLICESISERTILDRAFSDLTSERCEVRGYVKKLTFIEHQIGETGSEDCGACWGSWSSVILAIGLTCVIG